MAGNTVYRQFDSIGATLQFIKGARTAGAGDSSESNGSASWYGTETLDEAVRLMSTGWAAGRQTIAGIIKALPDDRAPERRTVAGMYGQTVDCARLIAGHPYSMYRKVNIPRARPLVRLRVNIGTSASDSAEAMLRVTRNILTAVCELERGGTAVEICAGYIARGHRGGAAGWSVRIKTATERFDSSRLAFSLSHPAMLRRIGFAVFERLPGVDWSEYGGYGYPMDTAAAVKAFGNEHGSIRWVSYGDCRTLEGARRQVMGK